MDQTFWKLLILGSNTPINSKEEGEQQEENRKQRSVLLEEFMLIDEQYVICNVVEKKIPKRWIKQSKCYFNLLVKNLSVAMSDAT